MRLSLVPLTSTAHSLSRSIRDFMFSTCCLPPQLRMDGTAVILTR